MNVNNMASKGAFGFEILSTQLTNKVWFMKGVVMFLIVVCAISKHSTNLTFHSLMPAAEVSLHVITTNKFSATIRTNI